VPYRLGSASIAAENGLNTATATNERREACQDFLPPPVERLKAVTAAGSPHPSRRGVFLTRAQPSVANPAYPSSSLPSLPCGRILRLPHLGLYGCAPERRDPADWLDPTQAANREGSVCLSQPSAKLSANALRAVGSFQRLTGSGQEKEPGTSA